MKTTLLTTTLLALFSSVALAAPTPAPGEVVGTVGMGLGLGAPSFNSYPICLADGVYCANTPEDCCHEVSALLSP